MTVSGPSSQMDSVGTSRGPIGKAAFAQMFRTEASYVGHSLRRLGVREADVEDLTQRVQLVGRSRGGEHDVDAVVGQPGEQVTRAGQHPQPVTRRRVVLTVPVLRPVAECVGVVAEQRLE